LQVSEDLVAGNEHIYAIMSCLCPSPTRGICSASRKW